jgi:hypothetical protein
VNVGLSEWLRTQNEGTDAARLVGMWTCRGKDWEMDKDWEMTDAVDWMGNCAAR